MQYQHQRWKKDEEVIDKIIMMHYYDIIMMHNAQRTSYQKTRTPAHFRISYQSWVIPMIRNL